MATLQQLIKVNSDIQKAKERHDALCLKRKQLVDELELNKPIGYYAGKAETLVTINDKPHRIWVYSYGDVLIEELAFN
jgi:hypothetical protein